VQPETNSAYYLKIDKKYLGVNEEGTFTLQTNPKAFWFKKSDSNDSYSLYTKSFDGTDEDFMIGTNSSWVIRKYGNGVILRQYENEQYMTSNNSGFTLTPLGIANYTSALKFTLVPVVNISSPNVMTDINITVSNRSKTVTVSWEFNANPTSIESVLFTFNNHVDSRGLSFYPTGKSGSKGIKYLSTDEMNSELQIIKKANFVIIHKDGTINITEKDFKN
jgi:hypothetical protein